MASVGQMYLHEMHERFGYLATWLPNAKLELGDVGLLRGEMFKQITTLRELGVPFTERRGTAPIDFNHTSASGVDLQVKAKGKAAVGTTIPVAQAGVAVRFSKQGAFVFQATDSRTAEIENKAAVGQAVIRLYEQGRWEDGWSVVDTVIEAGSATVLVANSVGAVIELAANATPAAANLARLDMGLAVNSQSGDITHFIAVHGLTPLFRLSRLKKSVIGRLFGGQKPIVFGGPQPEQALLANSERALSSEEVFERVTPDY